MRSNEFILATGATGTVTSSDLVNDGFPGLIVFVNVNSASGTTVTVAVQGKTPHGDYYPILTSAALGSPGLVRLEMAPGLADVANLKEDALLPQTWRVVATVTGSTINYDLSFDYSYA